MDARVLIVTQEKAPLAAALVAPHDIDTGVLAATIVLQALVHIWRERGIPFAFATVSNTPSNSVIQGILLNKGEIPLWVHGSQSRWEHG